jgi:hypothetical protein
VYSPRFIYIFQQLKTSFLLCLIEGLCLHPVLHVAWASLSPTTLCISGSLELVLWYCNNFYSNSVLFEVRNVVTSLLGLVIVSHLSPKGSGRFTRPRRGPGVPGEAVPGPSPSLRGHGVPARRSAVSPGAAPLPAQRVQPPAWSRCLHSAIPPARLIVPARRGLGAWHGARGPGQARPWHPRSPVRSWRPRVLPSPSRSGGCGAARSWRLSLDAAPPPGAAPLPARGALSHPDLKSKSGCISYVRQGRTTHIITECIEINVINIIMYLLHSGSLTKIKDKIKRTRYYSLAPQS